MELREKQLKDFLGKKEPERFDLKKTTMPLEIGEYLEYRNGPGYDVDVCPLNQEIYQTLWGKTERSASALAFCKEGETIKGDTMNSVQTTLNRMCYLYFKENLHILSKLEDTHQGLNFNFPIKEGRCKGQFKWSEERCRDLYKYGKDLFLKLLSEDAKYFLSTAYTIGNFIPIPSKTYNKQSFNTKRGASYYVRDYWDRTLYCIYQWYKWYKKGPMKAERWLEKLLPADKKIGKGADCIVNACKDWLKSFQDEKGNPSWDVFIEANYLQDYTEWTTRPYGRPKEFWDGHFSGSPLPETEEQIEAFFARATGCIKARSKRMVDALREHSQSQ